MKRLPAGLHIQPVIGYFLSLQHRLQACVTAFKTHIQATVKHAT